MPISAVAVFCGSKSGTNPLYEQHAIALGKILALHHIQLIYGGESKGLMWKLAEAALSGNGEVVGIIPKLLMNQENNRLPLNEIIVVENMHERKQLFYQRCDAAIVMPGGFGTLDEMFELLTWNQLEVHHKSIFILNSGGYYQHLLSHIQKMETDGFLYQRNKVTVLSEPKEFTKWL